MSWLGWFRREDDERQLRRELEAHLAERVDDLREGGMSETEARRQARREFGNAAVHLEDSRQVWHRRWLDDARRDVQYAVRTLLRQPVFTAVAVLTLALGIGAHTALFSVVNAIALQPIPVAQLDGVYSVQAVRPTGERAPSVSLAGLRALERELPDGALAVGAMGFNWWPLAQIPSRAEAVGLSIVSGGFASAFDIPPQLGRWIAAEDDRDGAPQRVVVISDRLWREWFGADPSIVGRDFLTVLKTPFRIVGVAPPGFAGLLPPGVVRTDAWMSIADWVAAFQTGSRLPEAMELHAFIRVRGRTLPQPIAAAVHTIVSSQPGPIYIRGTDGQRRAPETPAHALIPAADALRVPALTRVALLLTSLSWLVLLAASANLANMFAARYSTRTGELAVRLSLGAGRWRAMRLLLAEALLVGGAAALVGVGLGASALWALTTAFPSIEISRSERFILDFDVDAFVVLSAVGAGIVASMMVGFVAAWRITRMPAAAALASSSGLSAGAPRRHRTQTALVSVQVTTAVLLVMGAGLFIEEIREELSRRLHVHYDASALTAARVDVALHDYPEPRGRVFFDRLLSEARASGGVERASLADAIPGSRSGPASTTIIADDPPAGRAGEPPRIAARFMRVSPGFFDTVGLSLRAGRDFGPGDTDGAPLVAVVSESAADALWPGREPLGLRFMLGKEPVTIIGISPNIVSGLTGPREEYPGSERFLATRPSNYVFVPFAQHYQASMFVIVRAPGQAQAEALRAAVRRVDEQVAVLEASAVSAKLRWLGAVWSAAVVMLTLATVALAIAMLGVYGVVSFFVNSRMREFGIRLALGATPRGLMKLVFDYSLHIIIVGLLPAVFIATVASRLIESRQFDLMPNEISTWVAVPLLLVAAALVAGYFPARRASRVDPNLTLRSL